MANSQIQALYATGANLYAVIFDPVNGLVWNQTDQDWEAYNSAHWAQYAIAMTEYTGSGYYHATYPVPDADFVALSTDVIYARAGATPTLGDAPASNLYQSQGVGVGAVANARQAAVNMSFALGTQQVGAIVGTPASQYVFGTDLTNTQDDAYAGRALIMTSGTLIQQASLITGYDGATKDLTIQGFPSGGTPADTDVFVVV